MEDLILDFDWDKRITNRFRLRQSPQIILQCEGNENLL